MAFTGQYGTRPVAAAIVAAVCVVLAAAGAASGQGVDVESRPIAAVRVEGVQLVDQQLVLNQIRSKAGDPLDLAIVAQDIQNLTRLGRFASIGYKVEPNADGTVNLVIVVRELPLLTDVQVVGNKSFSDQELLEAALLRASDPRDRFLIDRARDHIRKLYTDAGYFLADVTVDEDTLEDTGILILRVREGPRVKVRQVRFTGNTVFSGNELASRIKTRKYVLIFQKGILSEDQLDQDVGRIRDHYQQHGFLDVRVSRRIELSDDQKDANVVFVIDEGDRYTVSSVRVTGNQVLPDRQIIDAMVLKLGDVYSNDRLKATNDALTDLYGKLGYIETRITVKRVFDPDTPTVNIAVEIRESRRSIVGAVVIRGNELTKMNVIQRQVRGIEPGRPFDTTGIPVTERRLRGTSIIDSSKITIQGEPDDEVRDVLIEVEEANTGSLSFGAAVTSDAGIFGAVDLSQKNFDIADFPESWSELFSGRAFRGAGQFFSVTLQPGDEFQRYQVSFREPYLFDSDWFFDTNAFFFTREREDWDEKRIGGTIGVGKRFGDLWSASLRTRIEQVGVEDVEDDAVIDARAVEGDSMLDSLGFFVARSTVDSRLFPTLGTRFEAGVEKIGVIFDDYDFWRTSAEWRAFLTVDEDFFGRKSVVSLRVETGYIFGDDQITVRDDTGTSHKISDAPLFERFYAGGHRNFRGFEFRGVGPRGIQINNGKTRHDPVGGNWLFLLGVEYNFPIYDKYVRGVVFVDSGTVQEDFGFDEYRVSVGTGIRLQLPFLGQAPFAFDIAFPLLKEEGDEERFFSFDVALPF